jgi:eukaryotic-like serine/threonine-protein kinase
MDEAVWARRWAEIDPIFERALDLPAAECAAFLSEACGGDGELRTAVEALLAASQAEGGVLDGSAGERAASLFAEAVEHLEGRPETPPDRVGPYRIGREIGVGGMARVYEAERADGVFRQKVAVKILRRREGAAEERFQRFLAEREILASLEHPGIARILDGGATDEGRPYLVMEIVDGEPLDRWCRQRQPALGSLLALFAEICGAVHFAHQRLVVHRDLKPSNILVLPDGRPKLLDFGIAKLLQPESRELDPEAPRTQTGLLLLTPEYAAPEQLRGEAVTTATDVYALGVILYELLVGRRPFDLRGKSPSEIERIVCEEEPTRPSTAVTRLPADADGRPDAAPARALGGDLDTIVLKALAKEPDRRYRSAAELADDLERYREGRPVVARPATMGYRLARFVRRHRLGVAAAAMILVVLVASAVLLGLQQRETARERDRARVEAAKARQVTAFLIDLFEASDPQNALGVEVTARRLLQTGREQIEAMEAEPAVRAELAQAIGQVYQSLASFEDAESLLREALELRRSALGERDLETAASRQALGELLRIRGSFAESAALLERALEVRGELAGERSREVAETLRSLARLARDNGDLETAVLRYEKALEAERGAAGARDPAVGDILSDLAVAQQELGRYAEAEDAVRQALEIWRGLLGENHPRIANALNNLGLINSRAGNYEAAERYYREALKRWDVLVDEGHPERVGVLSNLAVLLHKKGDYAEAVELKREVLAQDRKAFGDTHPYVAMSLNSLGATVDMLGDWDEAEALKREAVALYQRLYEGAHPELATALNNLAVLLEKKGELEEAEELSRASLRMRQTVFAGAHPMVAEGMHNLGRLLWHRGKLAEAEEMLRGALAMDREVHGEEHPHVAASMTTLGRLLAGTGRADEAMPLLENGLAMRRSLLGERHPDLADSLLGMAELAEARGDAAAERGWLAQALALETELLGPEHPEVVALADRLSAP